MDLRHLALILHAGWTEAIELADSPEHVSHQLHLVLGAMEREAIDLHKTVSDEEIQARFDGIANG